MMLWKILQGCDENFRKIFYGNNYESDLNEKYYKGKKKSKEKKEVIVKAEVKVKMFKIIKEKG